MIYAEFKDEIMRRFAVNIADTGDTSHVPDRILARWKSQFMRVNGLNGIPTNPRLINKFTLGADPEFLFLDQFGGVMQAQHYGLQAGLAFGMDTNGRLVELRPIPSRFALDIVASVLAELRWMSIMVPETMGAGKWISDPYFSRDGVGGHVHFARKRGEKVIREECAKLDKLFYAFMQMGFYDKESCRNRSNETHYGRFGDFRVQKHGYEYRSMPTWLQTPLHAYLAIVLSKLILLPDSPLMDALKILGPKAKPAQYEEALLNMLRFYKGQDDDALIALRALEVHGWPKSKQQEDFRPAWGIMYGTRESKPTVIPDMITPSEADRSAIFNYLTQGSVISPVEPIVTWAPTNYPKYYDSPFKYSSSRGRIGLGELLTGYAVCDHMPVIVSPYDHRYSNVISVPTKINRSTSAKEWKDRVRKWLTGTLDEEVKFTEGGNSFEVHVSSSMREPNNQPRFRKFLMSGLFPMWKVEDVIDSTYDTWITSILDMGTLSKKVDKADRAKLVGTELK